MLKASPTTVGLPMSAEIKADKVEISGSEISGVSVNLSGKAVDYALQVSAKATIPLTIITALRLTFSSAAKDRKSPRI